MHICPLSWPGPSAQMTYAWSSSVWVSPLPPGLWLCSRKEPLWESPDHSPNPLPTQHQIQMLLKHFKTEGKTSEVWLLCEQSGAPVQANKLSMFEHKTNETKITDFS